MKLNKPQKPDASKSKHVKNEDDLPSREEQIRELEERFASTSEAFAELQHQVEQMSAIISDKMKERMDAHVRYISENREKLMAQAEEWAALRVIEFFGACPMWELKKVPVSFYNKNDVFKETDSLFKSGWRYMGEYFYEQDKERYMLYCRPKDTAITVDQYLKMYREFHDMAKRSAAPVKKQADKPAVKTKK